MLPRSPRRCSSFGASGSSTPAPPVSPEIPAVAKVFVGIGKKDGATVNDLVAVLTKEVRLDRSRIGRVELRDGFMLVEIPAQDAERVAEALNRATIRRKRVVARVDRGAPPARRETQEEQGSRLASLTNLMRRSGDELWDAPRLDRGDQRRHVQREERGADPAGAPRYHRTQAGAGLQVPSR